MFWKPERRLARGAAQIHDPVVRLRFLRGNAGLLHEDSPIRPWMLFLPIILTGFLIPATTTTAVPPAPPQPAAPLQRADKPAKVWMVESSPEYELYSNGLRIDTSHCVSGHARSYVVFGSGAELRRAEPAGIVYHSTESDTLPLEPAQNAKLRRRAESVLAFVERRRAYHYLIDRFGRVYRTVAESDSANHAGNSVWAWDGGICLNLNHAFFGVAFEAKSDEQLSPAQIHTGRTLTETLRSRYAIRAENCVTHAQVSVNPANMRVGWHTDWARNFPFLDLGLPNNYERPLASVADLGFTFDTGYLDVAGEGLWIGVHRAEAQLKSAATEQGVSVAEWRHRLVRRYRELAKRG